MSIEQVFAYCAVVRLLCRLVEDYIVRMLDGQFLALFYFIIDFFIYVCINVGASFGKKNTTFISLDISGDLDNSNKFTEIFSFSLISSRLF